MDEDRSPTRGAGRAPGERKVAKAKGQRSIQSVEVGFRLIRALEQNPAPLSLKELAAAAGISPSSAHLYLVSFRRVGLVHQYEETNRYALGPYAAQLGLAALNQMDVVALSQEPMREVMAETGETVFLSVWGNRGPCIVSKVDGSRPSPMTLRVGYVLPLLDSATGRTFLAFMPDAVTAPVLKEERRHRGLRSQQWSPADLLSIVQVVRSNGLARNDSVINEGFVALAAPVFDHDGVLCAAMTVIGPSGLMDNDLDGKSARALKEAANRLSLLLGFPGERTAESAS